MGRIEQQARLHDVATIVATAFAVIVALVLILGAGSLTAGPPACATEDSVSCHWDANRQGNGTGRSFDAHADGTVTYTD